MRIYGIVTEDGCLAGAGILAFLGFFDQRYRDHDYDWGRTVAQQLLGNSAFNYPSELGPIRYTPAPIRPIDQTLSGLQLNKVPSGQVTTFKNGLTARINEILKDVLSNPIERYPAQLGADLMKWEFPRLCRGGTRSLTIPEVRFTSHPNLLSGSDVRSGWF